MSASGMTFGQLAGCWRSGRQRGLKGGRPLSAGIELAPRRQGGRRAAISPFDRAVFALDEVADFER
jgi:hypothetical protein